MNLYSLGSVIGGMLPVWLLALATKATLFRRVQAPLQYVFSATCGALVVSLIYGFGAQEALGDGTYWIHVKAGLAIYPISALLLVPIQLGIFYYRNRKQ